jgi:hypothetical protein
MYLLVAYLVIIPPSQPATIAAIPNVQYRTGEECWEAVQQLRQGVGVNAYATCLKIPAPEQH